MDGTREHTRRESAPPASPRPAPASSCVVIGDDGPAFLAFLAFSVRQLGPAPRLAWHGMAWHGPSFISERRVLAGLCFGIRYLLCGVCGLPLLFSCLSQSDHRFLYRRCLGKNEQGALSDVKCKRQERMAQRGIMYRLIPPFDSLLTLPLKKGGRHDRATCCVCNVLRTDCCAFQMHSLLGTECLPWPCLSFPQKALSQWGNHFNRRRACMGPGVALSLCDTHHRDTPTKHNHKTPSFVWSCLSCRKIRTVCSHCIPALCRHAHVTV